MINSFDDIYKKNIWTTGSSGSGSNYTKRQYKLIQEINDFIKSNNIITVADYGCGDFNIMQHLDFKNIKYTGIDTVQKVITENKQYEDDNIKFIKTEETPKGFDLVIVKDVLQHHQDEDVIKYLNELINNNKYVYCINGYKFMRDPDKNNLDVRNINNRYRYHPLHSIKGPLLQFNKYEKSKYTYYAKEYIIYQK